MMSNYARKFFRMLEQCSYADSPYYRQCIIRSVAMRIIAGYYD